MNRKLKRFVPTIMPVFFVLHNGTFLFQILARLAANGISSFCRRHHTVFSRERFFSGFVQVPCFPTFFNPLSKGENPLPLQYPIEI
jgi:hypothetical protein